MEKLGIVDGNRIGVSGWSYGGYMTTWLTGHYDVWKAAVSGAALTDWVMDYTIAYYQRGDLYFFGGSPWKKAYWKIWREQSPIQYSRNVKAPTLIMGDVGDGMPVLVRVHSECLTGDTFGSVRCDCGPQFQAALAEGAAEAPGGGRQQRVAERNLPLPEQRPSGGHPSNHPRLEPGARRLDLPMDRGRGRAQHATPSARSAFTVEAYPVCSIACQPLRRAAWTFSLRSSMNTVAAGSRSKRRSASASPTISRKRCGADFSV